MEKAMPLSIRVPGFSHIGGKHCETTALRKALAHNGINLSEEMLFGLGGGTGFIYWNSKQMPFPFIGGRNGKFPDFIQNICKSVGAQVEVMETSSANKGARNLIEVLERGQPCVVYGDIHFLPYFATEGHFGGHAFVIYGIEGDRALVSDRGRLPISVSLSDLEQARSSHFAPFAPKNRILKLSFPGKPRDIKDGIVSAMHCCYEAMIYPPLKSFGLSGLAKLADTVMEWPRRFHGIHLYDCFVGTFINIETGGTGGGAFRFMYANFLREAGQILKWPDILKAADLFENVGRAWNGISEGFLPDSFPELAAARRLLLENNRIFEEDDLSDLSAMHSINSQLRDLRQEVDSQANKLPSILSAVKAKIQNCYEAESKALESLSLCLP